MNNYNPLFNTMNMTRGISPFATAGSGAISSATRTGLLSKIGGSKITLSGILNGAQKTIGTVNQIVPLYNQVKPLFQNSKILLNVAKGIKGEGQTKGLFRSRRRQPSYTDPTINQNKQNNDTIDIHQKDTKKPKNTPSEPFFYQD